MTSERVVRRLDPSGRENRVKVGFFSITHTSPTGDDGPYLDWHQLDHMPEQYLLHGLVAGQRWASTPACRRSRAAESEGWASVEHVVCYLMGEPVDRTVDDFLALGQELTDVGRYPVAMPSQYRGALRLRGAAAAPRVLVSDVVVPFRPHRGIYLIVDEPETPEPTEGAVPRHLSSLRDEELAALLTDPGVAGVWTYTTSPDLRRSMFSPGGYRMTVCYLDDEPPAVGERLREIVTTTEAAPVRRVLAAPFESILRWEWGRFAHPSG